MYKTKIHHILGGLGLLYATQSFANTPTYEVYFNGGGVDAGSVVASGGAQSVPEGACGMRVSGADLLYEFYWAAYSAVGLGTPMPEAPWGPPSSATYDFPDVMLEPVIEFTGPLGEGCGDDWVFHLPLTGDWPVLPNGTPEGAGALVFQVTLPNGVEWLESGFQVWEPGKDPAGSKDPETPGPCEVFATLCEDPELTLEPDDACDYLLCDEVRKIDVLAQRAERLLDIAVMELHASRIDPRGGARLDNAAHAIRLARDESKAINEIDFAERPRDGKQGSTRQRSAPAAQPKARLGFAEVLLRQCAQYTERALKGDDRRTAGQSESRAIEHCSAAGNAFSVARGEVKKLLSD